MNEPRLTPCPFCGSEAEYETTTSPDESLNCACCPDCDISLMTGPIGIGWFATKAEAAQAWNRRSLPNANSTTFVDITRSQKERIVDMILP